MDEGEVSVAQPANPTISRVASAKCVVGWFMALLLFLELFYFLLPLSTLAAIFLADLVTIAHSLKINTLFSFLISALPALPVLQHPVFSFVASTETADALVWPLHEFVSFLAIPFLKYADNLVATLFVLLHVIIDTLSPLLFQSALEPHPFPLGFIRILGFLLLCEVALPHCSYRSGPGLRRRIWHLATRNQGHVIKMFGRSSSRTGAERRGVSRSGWSAGGPTDPASSLNAHSYSRCLSCEILLELLMRDDGGSCSAYCPLPS